MRSLRLMVPMAVCLVAFATAAQAQVETGNFQLTPYGGLFRADESSALKDAPIVGLEAVYYFSPALAIGLTGNFARGESDGSYFPAARWNVGPDTTRLFHVGQDLSIVTYGAVAKLGLTAGRLTPYAAAGVGRYTLFLDPQSNNRPVTTGGLSFEAGAGFHVALSERAGIRLDVRDLVFTDFDREDLYPVDERFRTDIFLVAEPPAAKSTIHNIRAAIGFTYVPGQ